MPTIVSARREELPSNSNHQCLTSKLHSFCRLQIHLLAWLSLKIAAEIARGIQTNSNKDVKKRVLMMRYINKDQQTTMARSQLLDLS
jgi:hypothetical protein